MGDVDKRPLPNTPASNRIIQHSNNRFGAVLSSLYSFWSARAAAVAGPQAARRDSYSVILFDHTIVDVVENDFASSPDELLDAVLRYAAYGGTNFTAAVQRGQSVMEQHWSTERCVDQPSEVRKCFKVFNNTSRTPVMIFLSDGECHIADQTIQDLCRSAVRLGSVAGFLLRL